MNVLIACAEYIEREAVNALIKAECSPKVAAYLIDAVAAIPAADVRPVRRGKWKQDELSKRLDLYVCSECGQPLQIVNADGGKTATVYCPNCGADMRETNDEEA